MSDFVDPMRLGELLEPHLNRVGMESGALVGRVWRAWPDIVGPDIAAHAEPTSLRQGVLRVRADSPAWSTELSYLTDQIRRRINEEVARELVREVRVWNGPGSIPRRGERTVTRREVQSSRPAADDPTEAFRRARDAWFRRWRKAR